MTTQNIIVEMQSDVIRRQENIIEMEKRFAGLSVSQQFSNMDAYKNSINREYRTIEEIKATIERIR